MSASTAPAAVPEPNGTPGAAPQNTPAPGFLTSMLTPVAPARGAQFSLDAQTSESTPATDTDQPSEGVSSGAFHSDGDGRQDTTSTGNGKQQQSVWRAWMLAGAARWGRGGGTQNKRLDMKKARAAAHQVKESRTVNSGPAGGPGAGGGRGSNGSGAGGGKSLDSKSSKSSGAGGGASKGPKNSTGPGTGGGGGGAGRGPSSRDTSRSTDRSNTGPKAGTGDSGGGRGPSSNGSAGSKGGTTPSPKPGTDNRSRSPKPTKDDTSSSTPKPSTGTKGSTTPGKGGTKGPSGPSGAPGNAGAGGSTGHGDKAPKPSSPKDSKAQAGKDSTGTSKAGPTEPPVGGANTTHGAATDKRPKLSLLKRNKTTAPQAPVDDKQPPTPDKTKTTTDDKTKTDTPTPGPDGKPFTTRPSRETGYRDGTRAARGAAHIKAYRDGVKDGWTDTTEAATREKTRLDQAHADRKTARQETPVTPTPDQTAAPAPIPVDHVSSTHITLGADAHRPSMTRGEVRSVKGFERRLEQQATLLDARAEQTRGLKAHADEQATHAGRLLDAARSADAGAKYIATLTRLQETAQVQAVKADEIHKRSLRGAEHCRTTLANVQARYGGIYQAVVDSPETSPAELDFYKG